MTLTSTTSTLQRAHEAINRVRRVHRHMDYDGLHYCDHCIDLEGPGWPCTTIAALDDRPTKGTERA